MATTFEQSEKLVREAPASLRSTLAALGTIDLDNVGRDVPLVGFAINSYVRPALQILGRFDRPDLEEIPYPWIDRVLAPATQLHTVLTAGARIVKDHADTAELAGRFADQTRGVLDTLMYALPILADEPTTDGRIARLESRAKRVEEMLASFSDAIDEQRTEVGTIQADAEKALTNARAAAEKAGITEYAMTFAEEANGQRNAGWWWLGATIVLGAVTFGWIGWARQNWAPGAAAEDWPVHAQNFGAKVVIASLLIWLVAVCLANYRACRHNFIVNKHRQNALMTFEKLAEGSADDLDAKRLVLTHATQAIFALQPTGYSEPAPTPPTQTLVEVLSKRKPDAP